MNTSRQKLLVKTLNTCSEAVFMLFVLSQQFPDTFRVICAYNRSHLGKWESILYFPSIFCVSVILQGACFTSNMVQYDIVQGTWLKVLRMCSKIQNTNFFFFYFYTTATNPCVHSWLLIKHIHDDRAKMVNSCTRSLYKKKPFSTRDYICISAYESMTKHSVYLIKLTAWLKWVVEKSQISFVPFHLFLKMKVPSLPAIGTPGDI